MQRVLPWLPLKKVTKTHLLLVEAPYYEDVGALLREGARQVLKENGVSYDLFQVPGALEIPLAASLLLKKAQRNGKPYDGIVALGCVIRGETFHFEIVAQESARGLMHVGLSNDLPMGNGILTVETKEQAFERADPQKGNKGGEAVWAALSLMGLRE